jgi:uncharacterized protein (TIGR04255 family)
MNYNNCPIVEAVLDIRVDGIREIFTELLRHVQETSIIQEFNKIEKKTQFQGRVSFKGDNLESSYNRQLVGVLFLNEERTKQLQIKPDGFSFHHLNKYGGWNNFFTQAIDIWRIVESFIATTADTTIPRLAIRTVNKINITDPTSDLDDYITIVPKIPKALPQLFEGLFTQISVPADIQDRSKKIIINQTIEPVLNSQALQYILDIDVVHLEVIPKKLNENDLIEIFEAIHVIKNTVFESCITDKTRETFN